MPAILHLEDDALDHKLVRATLAADGLGDNLLRVQSADEYTAALAARCYDVIISDYNLIGFDGLAALRLAQQKCGDVPFIILSGAMGETAAVEILKAGATDVVLKDRLERLAPAIRRAMREAAERKARKQAEDRLRASEERLRLMVESVRDYAIFSIDRAGLITGWNLGAERVFGYSEQEIIGHSAAVLFTPEDRAAGVPEQELATASRHGKAQDDRMHLRKDGSQFFASGVVTPVFDEDYQVQGFTKIARDDTERRQHDAELRRARDAAEAASRAKDHFLAVLSHELRTPLTPVLTTAQMMERDGSLSPQLHEAFSMIRRNIELEARLIDDLLDLTRISRGKMQLNLSTVDAHEKIRHVLEMCSDDARAKGVSLVEELCPSSVRVHADAARLQQVTWNLIKNAIKFTPAGGTITVRSICDAHDRFVLEIVDNGIGIEPDLLPKLFEPFEQGGQEVTRLFGGLGLGLAISKAIIELHKGTIAATSDGAGKGATFRIELPVDAEASRAALAPPAEIDGAAIDGAGQRVLLVEDNVDTAGVMAMVLQMSGFDVHVANTVGAALKSAAAVRPDVVVSDIGLPDGSGLDLMRQLHNGSSRRILGIALSGYGLEDDVRRSHEAGFVEHLTKPVDLDALERTVRRVASLAQRQQTPSA